MSVTLNVLKRRITEVDCLHPWVRPQEVTGFDLGAEFQAARKYWFDASGQVDLSDSAVEVIPDYLDLCLSRGRFHGSHVVDGADVLDAVIWLALRLGSSYAVFTLAPWRTLVAEVQPQAALERVLSGFEEAHEAFVRDVLRSVALEFFNVGTAWPGWQDRLGGRVRAKTVRALDGLLRAGYETIKNGDARQFSDGTPRFE